MEDRNVEFPSRYRLEKVAGTDDIYDLTPAPGTIYTAGTYLHKATLLKDATAALYGLGTDAVPDDVLAWLMEYCWRRRMPMSMNYFPKYTKISAGVQISSKSLSQNLQISKELEIALSTKEVSLKAPQTVSVNNTQASVEAIISKAPCYITNVFMNASNVYYIPAGATAGESDTSCTFLWSSSGVFLSATAETDIRADYVDSVVFSVETGGSAWSPVSSANRDAYPDSGTDEDGYEYEYLGRKQEALIELLASPAPERLMTLTLAEDTMTWTVDMSGIDLSQYAKVVIYPHIETANDQPIYLRTSADGENLMQIPTGYDGNARFGTSEMNISFRGSTVFFTQFRTNIWPRDTLTTQAPDVVCATLSSGVTHLDTLVFLHWSGDYPISAGSQIHIYGYPY